jgi:hypothetical protein
MVLKNFCRVVIEIIKFYSFKGLMKKLTIGKWYLSAEKFSEVGNIFLSEYFERQKSDR